MSEPLFYCNIAKVYCREVKTDRPHGEWIPCSERLPEENGWYIGSKVTPKGNHMTNSFWYEDGTFFTLGKVEAWMPLPEPYREEGEAE